ncbi:energy transducer TonB [Ekhidna sp.]
MRFLITIALFIVAITARSQTEEIDLGLIILDSNTYHFINPKIPKHYAQPKEDSLEIFIRRYVNSILKDKKFKHSKIYTSISFTVNKEGHLESFILGDQVSKIDTLIVTCLYNLGDWNPAFFDGQNQSQRFKLRIQSNDELIFTKVDDPASFIGGKEALYEFVYNNLTYPMAAQQKRINGRVFIQFVVEKDGTLTGLKIVKGLGSGTDEEVLRIFKKMPKWKPAKQRGKLVRQTLIEGVNFSLQ